MSIPSIVWLCIAGAAALIEALSLSLITMWFVVGALFAFIVSLFIDNVIVEIVVFGVVSVLCIIFLRPLIMKARKNGLGAEPTNVGRHAVVIETIHNDELQGRVETDDHMSWGARSFDNSVIEVGTKVEVVAQESVKLIVKPL